jgi:hypothetical protein
MSKDIEISFYVFLLQILGYAYLQNEDHVLDNHVVVRYKL